MPIFNFAARKLPPVPKIGQVDYWDKTLPGFGQRVSKGGTRTWVVMYRYNASKRRMKLGRFPSLGLADAREEAKEVLRKAEKGTDPATEKQVSKAHMDTVSDLAAQYMEGHAKRKKRSWKKDEQVLNREVLPLIGRKRVIDVTRGDIRDVLRPIVEREAPIRANHTLEVVRKMFNWAIAERDLPIANPAALIPKPGQVNYRMRYLKPDEIRRFWKALEPKIIGEMGVAAFRILLLTAQREMEVLRMRWEDINDQDRLWTIPADHAKNDLEHIVPLTPLVLKELDGLRRLSISPLVKVGAANSSPTGYVFSSPVNPAQHVRRIFVEKRIIKLRDAADIKDMTTHDLRRTVTTYLGQLRVPQSIKKKILNHAKRRKADVTEIYDQFEYIDEKREALLGWERLLLQMADRQADSTLASQLGSEEPRTPSPKHVVRSSALPKLLA